MRSRWGRWSIAAASIALAAVPAVLLLRLSAPSAPTHTAAAAARGAAVQVRDASRPAWYGLKVLEAPLTLQTGPAPVKPPTIKSTAAILVDLDHNRVLWEQNDHMRLPPASTIKMLTALVVLENYPLDRLVTATQNALFQQWDESKMFLHAGDALAVRDLLTGMLMVSANDAADVLAIDTVGMEKFVGAMNAQAHALGLHDTHVTSPVGLDDPQMYSSAYDLAVIAATDIRRFPVFDEIINDRAVAIGATPTHPAFFLNNINLLLSMYPVAIGVKTGYTQNAGACEVGMAVRDGHHLLSVILNGDLVYTSSKRLLDWGFTQEGLPTQLPTPSPSPSASPH